MNDDFILPKRWYIEITDDNREIVNSWKIKQIPNKNLYDNIEFKYVCYEGYGWWLARCGRIEVVLVTYEKITTEQFITHVLKQQFDDTPKQLENLDYLIPLFKELNIK